MTKYERLDSGIDLDEEPKRPAARMRPALWLQDAGADHIADTSKMVPDEGGQ